MRVKVTELGVTLPMSFLEGIEDVEIQREDGLILVRPLIADDSVFNIGKHPIDDEITDASINHDQYIY